jgi:hypothetical protein
MPQLPTVNQAFTYATNSPAPAPQTRLRTHHTFMDFHNFMLAGVPVAGIVIPQKVYTVPSTTKQADFDMRPPVHINFMVNGRLGANLLKLCNDNTTGLRWEDRRMRIGDQVKLKIWVSLARFFSLSRRLEIAPRRSSFLSLQSSFGLLTTPSTFTLCYDLLNPVNSGRATSYTRKRFPSKKYAASISQTHLVAAARRDALAVLSGR